MNKNDEKSVVTKQTVGFIIMSLLFVGCNSQERLSGRTSMQSSDAEANDTEVILRVEHNSHAKRVEVHNFRFDEGNLGIRNFEQLYGYMSRVTGVLDSNANTRRAFAENAGQLPSDNYAFSLTGVAQVNITKLAASFCNEAAADTELRQLNFGSLDFSQGPELAFSSEIRPQIFEHLARRYWGYRKQVPDVESRDQILGELLDEMLAGVNERAANETRRAASALCTAVLASLPGTVL